MPQLKHLLLLSLSAGCEWVHWYAPHEWLVVRARDDRWVWSARCNKNWQRKLKYPETICHIATLSTTNPRWTDLGLNLAHCSEKLVISSGGWLVAIFSLWRSRFSPRDVCVGFVVNKVTVQKVSLQVLWFSPVSYHTTDAAVLSCMIRGWYSGPIFGLSTQALSHPHTKNEKDVYVHTVVHCISSSCRLLQMQCLKLCVL